MKVGRVDKKRAQISQRPEFNSCCRDENPFVRLSHKFFVSALSIQRPCFDLGGMIDVESL